MTKKMALLIILITITLLILSIGYPILYQLFVNSNQIERQPTETQIIAHRGASKLAPENTLSAIEKALELGVDMIEFDIHLSKDGEIIVLHDEMLGRTTDGSGNVADYTLKELKTFDAGSWFGDEFKGERIPMLKEVLTLVDGKSTCLIEVKWNQEGVYKGMEENIVAEIKSFEAENWVIVQSFESSYLENINQLNPNIQLGKLLIGSWLLPVPFYFDYQFHWGKFTPPNYISWVNFYSKRATPLYIKSLKKKGVKVGVFTPNSEKDLIKQINMGVDAVITDNLDIYY